MCGRFVLKHDPGEMLEHYNEAPPNPFAARYNIAPTTPVLGFCDDGWHFFRWGLIPSWAKEISMGNRMFNARGETVAEKPSFRNAYKRRRCLIPASGFYEWRKEHGQKQPYYCYRDDGLFSMAGIWEHWQDQEGNEISSCAVITRQAEGEMASLHDRMPVYIAPDNYPDWLNHKSEKTDRANELIYASDPDYQFTAVSKAVNNSRNEGAALIEPIDNAVQR